MLELGEYAPWLEPLEFVSGECSSSVNTYICYAEIEVNAETLEVDIGEG